MKGDLREPTSCVQSDTVQREHTLISPGTAPLSRKMRSASLDSRTSLSDRAG
jgi:hypothetical protein